MVMDISCPGICPWRHTGYQFACAHGWKAGDEADWGGREGEVYCPVLINNCSVYCPLDVVGGQLIMGEHNLLIYFSEVFLDLVQSHIHIVGLWCLYICHSDMIVILERYLWCHQNTKRNIA